MRCATGNGPPWMTPSKSQMKLATSGEVKNCPSSRRRSKSPLKSATGSWNTSYAGFNLVGATFILECPDSGETWTNGQQPSSYESIRRSQPARQCASTTGEMRVRPLCPLPSCGHLEDNMHTNQIERCWVRCRFRESANQKYLELPEEVIIVPALNRNLGGSPISISRNPEAAR